MKHSTEYLYGDLGDYFTDMQTELAEHKIYCCERELSKITSVPSGERDTERYQAVQKAKEFNMQLLKEVVA